MGNLRARERLPWGAWLTAAALAGGLVAVLRAWPGGEAPAPWLSVLAVALAAVAAFVVLRGLQSYLWGVVAGLLLALHPLVREWSPSHEVALRALALELTVLASVLTSWQLLFRHDFPWKGWLFVAVLLCGAMGLAWPTRAAAGLAAFLVAGIGLLTGFVVGLRRSQRGAPRASGANLLAAAVLSLLTPAAGLALAPWGAWLLDWVGGAGVRMEDHGLDLLWAALRPDSPWPGLSAGDLPRWGWPTPLVVLPLAAWGLWRTVRRGWKARRAGQPPAAWLLTLFTAVTLLEGALYPPFDGAPVALASLAVLLSVFCIADLLRGLTERLVLTPPAEP